MSEPCWYCQGTGYQDVYPDQYSVTLTRRACVACDGTGRLDG